MFAGHVGAALAIARVERRINLGVFVLAALLLDLVLWLFVLLGWEFVTIPADFASTHQPEFVFPYSHGLLAAFVWSALAGMATFVWFPGLRGVKFRAAAFVSLAVFSHWLLDALVHLPELPLAGENSMKLGLGMWRNMPAALIVEAFITSAGLWLFLSGAALSRGEKLGLAVLSLFILTFTIVGMTVAPPPPSVTAMAASSSGVIVIVSLSAGWLSRRRR
jgi:hypothetical protein